VVAELLRGKEDAERALAAERGAREAAEARGKGLAEVVRTLEAQLGGSGAAAAALLRADAGAGAGLRVENAGLKRRVSELLGGAAGRGRRWRSTFSRTMWRLYGGAKDLVMWYWLIVAPLLGAGGAGNAPHPRPAPRRESPRTVAGGGRG
jgi:hypothetical protein